MLIQAVEVATSRAYLGYIFPMSISRIRLRVQAAPLSPVRPFPRRLRLLPVGTGSCRMTTEKRLQFSCALRASQWGLVEVPISQESPEEADHSNTYEKLGSGRGTVV